MCSFSCGFGTSFGCSSVICAGEIQFGGKAARTGLWSCGPTLPVQRSHHHTRLVSLPPVFFQTLRGMTEDPLAAPDIPSQHACHPRVHRCVRPHSASKAAHRRAHTLTYLQPGHSCRLKRLKQARSFQPLAKGSKSILVHGITMSKKRELIPFSPCIRRSPSGNHLLDGVGFAVDPLHRNSVMEWSVRFSAAQTTQASRWIDFFASQEHLHPDVARQRM